MLIGYVRLGAMTAGLGATAALLAVPQLVLMRAFPQHAMALPKLFHRGFLRLAGVRRIVHGEPAQGGALFVANHVSWTDIPLLGSVLGGAFISMAEVAGWPVAGTFARLAGTLFVERERPGRARAQAGEIARHLQEGRKAILFPEGGTSTGETVLPFKTSLFAAAEGAGPDTIVQPVSLAYTRRGGRTLDPDKRAELAWVGEAPLVPHAAQMLSRGPVTAELLFHPPVRRGDFADRKVLARHCQEAVAAGVAKLTGG